MNPDDPRLTAYALGELDAAGRAEIEELLRKEPVIAAEVVATRQYAEILRVRLKNERAEPLHSGQRAEVLACAERAMRPRAHAFPRQITGWLSLAAGVVLGIGIALLFPALNSWKVPPTSAGDRQSSPQDGSDVRVALAADPAPPDGDAVVVNDWPLVGAMPVFPNPHGAMWAVGWMTSPGGDSVWHLDTTLPVIEFSPPPVAQNAAPISASNRRTIFGQMAGAKTLREARYATAPFSSAAVEWDTRAVNGGNPEQARELPARGKHFR